MDLSILQTALTDLSPHEFDEWMVRYEKDISNFFYQQSGIDLNNMSFDNFYYQVISPSKAYQQYHADKKLTEAFSMFLNIISVAAEKLAGIGIDSLAQTLATDLPKMPSRYRLLALNEFSLVEDIRTDYIDKLPVVLEILDQARLMFEDENLRPVVDVLSYYYKKAISAFEKRGLSDHIVKLTELYADENLTKKYPFLTHPILDDLINNRNTFELYPIKVIRERLEPSMTMKGLFSKINSELFGHQHVNYFDNDLWGYTIKHVLDEVLIRGRGDFTKSYGKISADDKVLLYCFFNMKKHFFTSYAVFETVILSLKEFFKSKDYKPIIIDLGCGPMTSGLALADLIHESTNEPINFSYIGIDISNAMMERASIFENLPIFSDECTFNFFENWNNIEYALLHSLAGVNNPIIFNASYLFASTSLPVDDLAKYISSLSKLFSNVYLVFQNPKSANRNVKYDEFKTLMRYEQILEGDEDIRYKASSYESSEIVYYEILKFLS